MKINGLKHLNSNWYDSIMIRNINKNETIVDVKNSTKIDTIKSDSSFYNEIKKLSDKEKIAEIIKYYLRNNRIISIKSKEELEKYKGEFLTIRGSRDLYLQLDKNSVDKNIINLIINKYIQDRKCVYNNTLKNIKVSFGEGESYYTIVNDDFLYKDEEVLSIKLASINNKLLSFEEDFFINFIKEKINNVDEEVEFKYKNGLPQFLLFKGIESMRFSDYKGYYIKCDKFNIRLDEEIFYKVINIVNEHNNNLKKHKKLQLSFDNYK